MVLDKLNGILRDVGSGKIFASMQGDTIRYIIYFAIAVVALAGCLDVLKHLKKKGAVTKPSVDKTGHCAMIAELINAELKKLYENRQVISGIHARLGGYRQAGQLAMIHLDNSNLVMRSQVRMGFFFVARYRLNKKAEVANGDFGMLYLNRYFFGSQTMHHHYAMIIAARLLFLQAFAVSGKDPRNIVSKESFMKKAGESVLSLAGKLREYAALHEKDVLNLTRHDRKVDDRILQTLGLSDDNVRHIESELGSCSRSVHDALTGKGYSVVDETKRLSTLLEKEKEHLEHLKRLAQEKADDLNRLLRQGVEKSERRALEMDRNRFEADMHRFGLVISSIDSVARNISRWKLEHRSDNHHIRKSRLGLSAASREIDQEAAGSEIDIHKIHAILSAITAEKAELLKGIKAVEAVR